MCVYNARSQPEQLQNMYYVRNNASGLARVQREHTYVFSNTCLNMSRRRRTVFIAYLTAVRTHCAVVRKKKMSRPFLLSSFREGPLQRERRISSTSLFTTVTALTRYYRITSARACNGAVHPRRHPLLLQSSSSSSSCAPVARTPRTTIITIIYIYRIRCIIYCT